MNLIETFQGKKKREKGEEMSKTGQKEDMQGRRVNSYKNED